MSSLGGICICGAGCKRETGCRGYGRHHEMETTTHANIISGIAPVNNYSVETNKSSEAEEGPDCKRASCNCDPCSC